MTEAEDSRARPGFAVVGLGKMGIMHTAMLGVVPGGGVSALVDRDEAAALQAQSMGVQAKIFSELDACLDDAPPAGVFITTPQSTHRRLFETCIARGVPVFCEKPLAHDLADARAMAAAAAARPDLPVAVGFMLAHNPLFERAATMLKAGAIGGVKSFRASTRLSQVFGPLKGWTFTRETAGGGVLINSGCHLLWALRTLFGQPARVFVRASPVHSAVEDTLGALLEYPAGLWGMMEVTWSVPGHEFQTHDIEVIGTRGTIEVGNEVLRLWLHEKHGEWPEGWTQWFRSRELPRAEFSLSPEYCGDEFYLEVKDFVEAVRKGTRPKVTAADALEIQLQLDAIYRSADSRQPVDLPAEGAS